MDEASRPYNMIHYDEDLDACAALAQSRGTSKAGEIRRAVKAYVQAGGKTYEDGLADAVAALKATTYTNRGDIIAEFLEKLGIEEK